jgi:hypothetical protein
VLKEDQHASLYFSRQSGQKTLHMDLLISE